MSKLNAVVLVLAVFVALLSLHLALTGYPFSDRSIRHLEPPSSESKVAEPIATPEPAPCAHEIGSVVINKVAHALGEDPKTIAEADRYDNRIRCIREWSMSLPDPCLRQSYETWLDAFERSSKGIRKNLQEGREPVDEWKQNYDREQRRIAQYERAHAIPAPPDSCERGLIEKAKP